jgi:hypothetical protein
VIDVAWYVVRMNFLSRVSLMGIVSFCDYFEIERQPVIIKSSSIARFSLMHQSEQNDERPWRQGFYAAMRLRISAWAPLLDASNLHSVAAHPDALLLRSGPSAARTTAAKSKGWLRAPVRLNMINMRIVAHGEEETSNATICHPAQVPAFELCQYRVGKTVVGRGALNVIRRSRRGASL